MRNNQFSFLILLGLLIVIQACSKDANLQPSTVPDSNTPTISARLSGLTTSCIDGIEVQISELPIAAQNYLADNYPSGDADDADRYDDMGILTYSVEIDETLLIFDADGTLLASGQETDIALADLSTTIQSTIDTDYPTDTIEHASSTLNQTGAPIVVVELTSGINLLFDEEGTLLCEVQSDNDDGGDDDGDDDDDDEININDLPQTIQSFLNIMYPGYTPTGADFDSLCNGTIAIVVELESMGNPDLSAYFTTDGVLLYNATELPTADLPVAVTDAISVNYPSYVMENHAYQLELPDGMLQYNVSLDDSATNTDLDVIFAADGSVICEHED